MGEANFKKSRTVHLEQPESAETHDSSPNIVCRRMILTGCLSCCLTSSVAFASVSFPTHHGTTFPPSIDFTFGSDEYAKKEYLAYPEDFPGGRIEACFSTRDAPENGERRGRPDWLGLPMTACVGLSEAADEAEWPGYEAQGDHARSLGNWSEAERAYAQAVEVLERGSVQHVDQGFASLLDKLGAMRHRQKDLVGAETAYTRALTIYTSTRGADDLRVADLLDQLATVLFEQQPRRSLAGPLFYRAWAVREKLLGPNHPAVADSLHHLAFGLYADNVSRAIPILLRSMEIREKAFGHDHPLVAESVNAMAVLYETHDRLDLAIPLYQQALTIQETVFGPGASETQQARDNLEAAHRGVDLPQDDPNERK
jgi:tetratricopeptide (TPR) repeat protein